MTTRTPSGTVTNVYGQNTSAFSDSNNLLLLARRGTRDNADTQTLSTIALYTPYTIPSQYMTNPNALLSYFKNDIGATVQTGVEDNITLSAPDTVTSSTVSGDVYIKLTWNSEPEGWDNISGITIVGTATQGVATGTIFKVSASGYVLTLSQTTGTFDTVANVALSYINKSVTLPDGDATEAFVLAAYYAATGITGVASTANVTVTQPTVDLIFVSDRDSVVTANSTELDLGAVDVVVDNGDGTLTFEWTSEPANWKYVPANGLGQSYIEGATPADTAVIEHTLGTQYSQTLNPYNILVTPAGGASFSDSDVLSLNLDDTVSLFDQVSTRSYKFTSLYYEFTDTDEITEASGALALYTDYLEARNGDSPVANGQLSTFGVVGYTTTSVDELETQASADLFYYITPFYPYTQKFNDVTFGGGELAANAAAILSANEVPFNAQTSFVLSGIPVSSDPSTYLTKSVSGDSEVVLQKGATPIGVNAQGEAYIIRPITTQTTIPGSNEEQDNLYFDTHAQQVIGEIKNRTYAISEIPEFNGVDITDDVLAEIENEVYGLQVQAELEGMLNNVAQNKVYISATVDPSDSERVDISQTIQPTQSLNSMAFTNNIGLSAAVSQTEA